jgi:hypothetical protein
MRKDLHCRSLGYKNLCPCFFLGSYGLCASIGMALQVLNALGKASRSRSVNVSNKAEVVKDVLRLGCYKQCYLLSVAYEIEEDSISSPWHIIAEKLICYVGPRVSTLMTVRLLSSGMWRPVACYKITDESGECIPVFLGQTVALVTILNYVYGISPPEDSNLQELLTSEWQKQRQCRYVSSFVINGGGWFLWSVREHIKNNLVQEHLKHTFNKKHRERM